VRGAALARLGRARSTRRPPPGPPRPSRSWPERRSRGPQPAAVRAPPRHVVITNEPHLIEFEQVGLNAGLSELLSGSAVAVSAPHVAYHLSAARPGPSATSPWPARRPPVDFGAKNIQARDSRSQKV